MSPNTIVMNASSMLLLSEYAPMIEMRTMNGVRNAYGTRMIDASSGTARMQMTNVRRWPR